MSPATSSSRDAIRQHRAADVTVTVRRPDGAPLAGYPVVVAQQKHAFGFGGNGSRAIPLANNELDGAARARGADQHPKLLELFNVITLPFYWGRFEPQRGKPDTRRLLNAARWF